MNAGNCIKIAIIKAGITQVKLSQEMGVTKDRVYHWCKSKSVSTSVLERIAAVLGMKVSELMELGE